MKLMGSKRGRSVDSSEDLFDTPAKKVRIVDSNTVVNGADIEEDDQVYVFQCAKNIDPTTLIGTKIRFNEKIEIDVSDIGETYRLVMEENDKSYNIVSQGKPDIVPIQVKGKITTVRKLKTKKIKKLEDVIDEVPFPSNIRERHPLLGSEWEKRILQARSALKGKKKDSKKKK